LDYAAQDSTPRLRKSVLKEADNVRTSFSVADVHGEIDVEELQRMLEHRCKAEALTIDASTGSFEIVQDMQPRVLRVEFAHPPTGASARAHRLSQHDSFLSSIIDLLPSSKYTVIYTTSPASSMGPHILGQSSSASSVENFDGIEHWQSDLHAELKRGLHSARQSTNETTANGALFERYAFLSPGIFMGLLVVLPLLGILFVALTAVSSLQVSYAAFAKEMGPQAQKRQ